MKRFEIFLKNILLRILLTFSKSRKIKSRQTKSNYSKILFIRLNRIGDALVSTPLLHLVKKKLNSKIYLLADQKNHFVFKNNPDVDKIFVFKKGIKGIREILKLIEQERIDTIIDLHDDVSTTVSFLIALSKVENKFGLEKDNKIIYTKTVPRLDSQKTHIVTRLMELGKLFDLQVENEKPKISFFPSKNSLTKAEEFISVNFNNNNFTLGINISAGSDARFWGVEKYKELISYIFKLDMNLNPNILLIAAPRDLSKAIRIKNLLQEHENLKIESRFAIFSSENFDEFASIVSKTNLLFTPDTAAVHVAAAFGIPVFGVYVHDTEDMIWSPIGVDFDYIETRDSNLNNLNFDSVIKKFYPFLDKKIREFAN